MDKEYKNLVLGCQNCKQNFVIEPDDFSFYEKMKVLVPKICPDCRHYERLKERNPIKLWKRNCMCDKVAHGHNGKCSNKFETSYSPEGPEIVYCEKCYQQEVY